MITIFNRKELLITYDMNKQAQVRSILSANNVAYSVKTVNLQSMSSFGGAGRRGGSFGINPDYTYEYRIYVHKKDYELAAGLIQSET